MEMPLGAITKWLHNMALLYLLYAFQLSDLWLSHISRDQHGSWQFDETTTSDSTQ